ncbi:MAG: type II toxin-antitoxin system RelE/ParE family toxin [Acidobacteria bacterium]|nr:type II toxin-antitoxin system RelE/ParE family toxin [Acidobacteriota bacterium]
MGMYSLIFKPSVEKDLRRIPSSTASRIVECIEGLKKNPFPPTVVKLTGAEKLYRLRVRDYRIIYEVDNGTQAVIIHYVRHLRDVYRRLP